MQPKGGWSMDFLDAEAVTSNGMVLTLTFEGPGLKWWSQVQLEERLWALIDPRIRSSGPQSKSLSSACFPLLLSPSCGSERRVGCGKLQAVGPEMELVEDRSYPVPLGGGLGFGMGVRDVGRSAAVILGDTFLSSCTAANTERRPRPSGLGDGGLSFADGGTEAGRPGSSGRGKLLLLRPGLPSAVAVPPVV